MSGILRAAAAAVRSGADLEPAREALATLLDAESVVRSEMKPFLELINATITHKSGVESVIRFCRDEAGDVKMDADTSGAAYAVADAVLGQVTA